MTTPKAQAAPKAPQEPQGNRYLTVDGGTGAAEKTALYWCGITPVVMDTKDKSAERPPFSSRTFAGITFMLAQTPWEGGRPQAPDHKRGWYPGAIVEVTDAKLRALDDLLPRTVIRWHQRSGVNAHGYPVTFLLDEHIDQAKKQLNLTEEQTARFRAKTRRQASQPTDEPLAKYLYCVKLEHPDGYTAGCSQRPPVMGGGRVPPSLLEVGSIDYP